MQDDHAIRAGYLIFGLDVYYKQKPEEDFVRLYNDFMTEFAAYPEFLEGIKEQKSVK